MVEGSIRVVFRGMLKNDTTINSYLLLNKTAMSHRLHPHHQQLTVNHSLSTAIGTEILGDVNSLHMGIGWTILDWKLLPKLQSAHSPICAKKGKGRGLLKDSILVEQELNVGIVHFYRYEVQIIWHETILWVQMRDLGLEPIDYANQSWKTSIRMYSTSEKVGSSTYVAGFVQ